MTSLECFRVRSNEPDQPDPTQSEFGPWGSKPTRLNPNFGSKIGFNPKKRVGFGHTTSDPDKTKIILKNLLGIFHKILTNTLNDFFLILG